MGLAAEPAAPPRDDAIEHPDRTEPMEPHVSDTAPATPSAAYLAAAHPELVARGIFFNRFFKITFFFIKSQR